MIDEEYEDEDVGESSETIEKSQEDYAFELANLIFENIKENFLVYHLSGNLVNTMTLKPNKYGNGYIIDITAQRYDIKLFREKGSIKYTDKGSYAVSVDNSGGFSHSKRHKNFAMNSVAKGIKDLPSKIKKKVKIVKG